MHFLDELNIKLVKKWFWNYYLKPRMKKQQNIFIQTESQGVCKKTVEIKR